MQYLCLIYEDEKLYANMDEGAMKEVMDEYFSFTEAVKKAGVLVGGEALKPVATATSLQLRQGKLTTTDGPFAETKEQLGGYYLLDCKDLDEAIGWAQKIPGAKTGTIEVRPVMIFD